MLNEKERIVNTIMEIFGNCEAVEGNEALIKTIVGATISLAAQSFRDNYNRSCSAEEFREQFGIR